MKITSLACVGVFAMVSGVALASNNPPMGSNGPINPGANPGNYIAVPDCATGFSKSNAMGSQQSGSYSWTCSTPKIICPSPSTPAPDGQQWNGGLKDAKATASGSGEKFSYVCSFSLQAIVK